MAAGALITGESGRVLLVKPIDKPDWLRPGDRVGAGEVPQVGCERGVREETGLVLTAGALLALAWCCRFDQPDLPLPVHRFDHGTGSCDVEIVIPGGELSDYGFFDVDEAERLLAPDDAPRLRPALAARLSGTTAYLSARS